MVSHLVFPLRLISSYWIASSVLRATESMHDIRPVLRGISLIFHIWRYNKRGQQNEDIEEKKLHLYISFLNDSCFTSEQSQNIKVSTSTATQDWWITSPDFSPATTSSACPPLQCIQEKKSPHGNISVCYKTQPTFINAEWRHSAIPEEGIPQFKHLFLHHNKGSPPQRPAWLHVEWELAVE